MKHFISILALLMFSSCTAIDYYRFPVGKLEGRLKLEWYENDKFTFQPDASAPLKFTRANNDVIQPGEMDTDGGSIPRILWTIKSYSPWGYAPAFIIHDWLFEMRHCEIKGYEKYTVHSAAEIMAEVIKTMMESPKYGGKQELVLSSMYAAVNSTIAEKLWNQEGLCKKKDPISKTMEFYSVTHPVNNPLQKLEVLQHSEPLGRKIGEYIIDVGN